MSTTKKIAIVSAVFPPYRGGIGTVAYHQARVLAERGNDVTVLTPDYGYKTEILKQVQDDGTVMPNLFRHLKIKPLFKYGNAAWVPSLKERLKDFDVVILQYPFFGGMKAVLQAKKKYGFKLVVYYHMDVVATLRHGFGLSSSLKGLVFWYATRFFLPRLIKAADLVLASSEDYARHSALGRYWQASEKFQVVPIGVDINRFAFSDAPRERMALFVGGLDKAHYFKGVEYLIKAIRMIRITSELSESAVKFIIAGKGELMSQYQKLAHDLGVTDKVEFVGGVSDEELVKLYQKAAVTVLPSIDQSEAFGIVLVESMACGTPVIASDLPGVRSVFENGVSGFTVAPRNSQALAERIQFTIDNPERAREMGRTGRRLVEERYDWERVGDNLWKLVVGKQKSVIEIGN